MRRITIGLLATMLVAGSAARAGAATASVSVDPSTDLGVTATVQVTAAGFPAATQLGSAECISGAVDIGSCDLSTVAFGNSDADGAAQFSLRVRAEIATQNGAVDCTVTGACVVAVAVVSDITNTAVTVPISFAPLAPPRSGTIDAPTAPVSADNLQTVTAQDFAPSAMVEFSVCAHGAASTDDCQSGADVYTDDSGAAYANLNVPATAATPNGDVDCTVTGACDFAVWDIRDFSTVVTSPLAVAPLVTGTLTVTPSMGLHDGELVQLTGAGWPANQFLSVGECNGTFPDHCAATGGVGTDAQGNLSTPWTITSNFGADLDCDLNNCSIAATWSASSGIDMITAQTPISFATTPEVAHYSDAELAALQQAASTLGMTPARLQHDASYALDFVLHLAHVATITPVPDAGPNPVETDWLPADDQQMTSYASSTGATLPEFEKTAALFVAYVLSLSN